MVKHKCWYENLDCELITLDQTMCRYYRPLKDVRDAEE